LNSQLIEPVPSHSVVESAGGSRKINISGSKGRPTSGGGFGGGEGGELMGYGQFAMLFLSVCDLAAMLIVSSNVLTVMGKTEGRGKEWQ